MDNKLKEADKLKFWLDAEFATLKAFIGAVLYNQVTAAWQQVAILVYVVVCLIYATIRLSYVASHDKDYLRIPKR